MRFANIASVFRKELLDTLRDRKTLFFVLAMPLLIMPGIMFGITKITKAVLAKKAVEEVIIVADADTQRRYEKLVHDWFLSTQAASGVRLATSPMMKLLLRDPQQRELIDQIPENVLTDPGAFHEWTREIADKAREVIADRESMNKAIDAAKKAADGSTPGPSNIPGMDKLGADFSKTASDLFFVAFRGLGLVKFVDPKDVAPPPANAPPIVVPDALKNLPNGAAVAQAIKDKRVHAYLTIPATALTLAEKTADSATVTIYYDSTINLSDEAQSRVQRSMETAGKHLVQVRLEKSNLPASTLEPLKMADETDLASKSSRTFSQLGGMLPYLLIAFAFLGGIFPAIDIGAGEKERNTLETLLLAPVTRTEIALGKFFMILTSAMTAALLAIGAMAVSFYYLIPKSALQQLDFQVAPSTIAAVLALALPTAIALSGLLLAISIFARTFKEAQNYMAPLQFVIILPAMAAMIPGLELNWKLAMIPMVNVSMISRDFLKGDINWLFYGETVVSCLTFAAVCVAACVFMFRREEVLFRS